MNVGSAGDRQAGQARQIGQEMIWQVAECLLPGVNPEIAEALGDRVRAELVSSRSPVAFLGSLLMPEDEVLLCLFAGPPADVRTISERAELPFERILRCVGLGWLDREQPIASNRSRITDRDSDGKDLP